MKSINIVLIAGIVLVSACAFYTAKSNPKLIAKFELRQMYRQANLIEDQVVIENQMLNCLETRKYTKSETIIFLHGLFGEHHDFLKSVCTLSKEYNILMPELPWAPGTIDMQESQLTLDSQARILSKMIAKKAIEKYHIVGHNISTALAAKLAADYPEQVLSLCMINSTGIAVGGDISIGHEKDPFYQKIDAAFLAEKVQSPIYLAARKLSAKKFAANVNRDIDFIRHKLFTAVSATSENDFGETLEAVKAPVLLIWGKNDYFQNKNYQMLIQQKLRSAETKHIPDAGYVPQIEQQEEFVLTLSKFYEKTNIQRQAKNRRFF